MSTETSIFFTDRALAELVKAVEGPVFLPGDIGYVDECAGFNLLVHHWPAVIVGATCASDIQAAVHFATNHGLPVAVMCTGHQPFDPADGSVLITTERLGDVEIDVTQQTARIGAGARWQQVVDVATTVGLAPLCGSSPKVGVAGYVLGGGHSPIMGRTFGWAADHVHRIDVVTADGQLRRITADSGDLFWALRGGKSNFGVVTELEISLFEVDTFYGGGLYFDGKYLPEVLDAYRELINRAPDELNSSVALLRLPDLPAVPEFLRNRFVVHVRIAYLGTFSDGETLVSALRSAAPAFLDTLQVMPFKDFAAVHQDPADPMPYEEASTLLTELTAEAVDILVTEAGADSNCAMTLLEIRHLGGALSRQPAVPNAVASRDANITVWGAAVGVEDSIKPSIAHMEDLIGKLTPWATGRKYLNFMSGADPVEEAYSASQLARLRSIKAEYDPGNLFRLNNHNIAPAS